MEISFILTINNNDNPEDLDTFLKKIFAAKQNNFEIIIIDNYFYDSHVLKIINHFFNLHPEQIQIISSYKPLDNATSRNWGITIAKGKYLAFLHITELVELKYFKTVFNALKKYPNIDCLEYAVDYDWGTNYQHQAIIRIEPNRYYRLDQDEAKQVYALVSPLLATKLFAKQIIIENEIKFRKPLQFSSYFVYAFLAHAKTFVALKDCLITNHYNLIHHDNSFDLINQWIHILNYYNNLGLKKKYSDELEYASLRYMLYGFLWAISTINNKTLIQKVYDHIKDIVIKRHKDFRKNPYLTTDKADNDEFPIIFANFDQYMKKFFKINRLRDDSRFWK